MGSIPKVILGHLGDPLHSPFFCTYGTILTIPDEFLWHFTGSSMPESHKLVYLTRMFPVFMELFTGTLPVNTESRTGIVPANNLFQNKSSGNIKLT